MFGMCVTHVFKRYTHTHACKISCITYGPRKAVAEVSNHKEPIGKRCAALMRKSNDVRLTPVAVQVAWLSNDFDRHFISGLLVHRFSDSSDLDVE